jgi:NADH-quinone oxidoreductase subunit I
MGYFTDTWRALRTTLRNGIRPPVTVNYPAVIRPRPERYHTSFALLHDAAGDELCIGCLACERICPSRVVTVKQAPKRESPVTGKKRGYADELTIGLTACLGCELCVQVCPTDALVMLRAPEPPSFHREDLLLDMKRLYANEKAHAAGWATGSRLMEMQDPAAGQPKPEKKARAVATAAPSPASAEPVAPSITTTRPPAMVAATGTPPVAIREPQGGQS